MKTYKITWWKEIGFQEGISPLIEQLVFFHDHIIIILVLIISIVGYCIVRIFYGKYINRYLLENQSIEIIWTVLPVFILLFIAFPSLRLLYLLDEVNSPRLTLKVVGHQWYWRYEYSDYKEVEFDRYIIPESELEKEKFRVLEVDNRTIIPFNTQVRVLVTAADVIHSWTIPRLGVKVDAVPGRLNQLRFFRLRPGLLYGQCSEICGANHSFIPIVIEGVSTKAFINWLSKR